MPTLLPVPTKNPGDVLTSTLWNSYLRDNVNKLLNQGHRVLTVAQFAALTGLEGTKGTVAPDEVYLEVDSANGIQWHLAYESGEPTYKWRYIGGPAMVSEVQTTETTTSVGAYVALATAGPSVALSRAGDYDVDIEFKAGNDALGEVMSYDIGATGAVDADSAAFLATGGGGGTTRSERRKAAVAASTTLTAKYYIQFAGTGNFRNRRMRVKPVRLI